MRFAINLIISILSLHGLLSCGTEDAIEPLGQTMEEDLPAGAMLDPMSNVPVGSEMLGRIPLLALEPIDSVTKSASHFSPSNPLDDISYHLVMFRGDLEFYPHYRNGITDSAFRIYRVPMQLGSAPAIHFDWTKHPKQHASRYRVGLWHASGQVWHWFTMSNDIFSVANLDPYIDNGAMSMVVSVSTTTSDFGGALNFISFYAKGGGVSGIVAQAGFDFIPIETLESQSNGNWPPTEFAPGLPLPSSVDYSNLYGPCGDQHTTDSCSYWATIDGVLALELQMAYGHAGWSIANDNFRPSVRYPWVQTQYMSNESMAPGLVGTGNKFSLEFLRNYGTCSDAAAESDADLYIPNSDYYLRDWGSQAESLAKLIDIENYWYLNNSNKSKLKDAIRVVLARHKRAVALSYKFSRVHQIPGAIGYGDSRENAYVFDPAWFDLPWLITGSHAVAIVGYDDRAEAFLMRNSWGADGPTHGYFWYSYENFTNPNLHNIILGAWTVCEDFDNTTAEHYLGLNAYSPPPGNIRASCGSQINGVTVAWDCQASAVEYRVFKDIDTVPIGTLPVPTPAPNRMSFVDTAALSNKTHTYWVQPVIQGSTGWHLGLKSRPVYGWRSGDGPGEISN